MENSRPRFETVPGRAVTRRPQLTVEELHQLRWLLGSVLTLLSVWTVFYMDVDAWTLMVITSAAAIATVVSPTLPARIPRFVHTLAFPAIVAFFSADLWLKSEVLPAMVRLDILLLLYRSITYRARRDDLQVIVLGLFLIIIAGVLTVSLTFAAQILCYTACALAFLFVITLADSGSVPAQAGPADPRAVPSWAAHADWPQLFRRLREVANWRALGLGGILFAAVVAVSALLFLAIPRFQLESSMLLERFITKKAKSGFNDTIRFGDVTEIQQDTSVALSVDISDQSQVPATPYWRMLVLDQYEGGTFRLSRTMRGDRFDAERSGSFLVGRNLSRRGPPVFWTFFLESGISRYLPLLGHFERMRFRETQNFRSAPTLGVVELRTEPVSMTAYLVEDFDVSGAVRDDEFAKRWEERMSHSRAALMLQLAVGEEDVATLRQLAVAAAGEEQLPAAQFALRVNDWLRRNHDYSLSPRIPAGAGDPLIRWVNSREAGHCELFAGSFVLLARAAGHPARIVTGFRGGSWNAYSQNFTVRNSDAHAWAEIFDPATGSWLRADPLGAPAGGGAEEAQGQAAILARLDRSWTARLDSLRVFWYRRIVSFDQRSQAETLRAVKEATQSSGRRLRETLERYARGIRNWVASPWSIGRWLGLVAVIALSLAAGWWWREFGHRWTRRWLSRRGPNRGDPVRQEASRWLRAIREFEARIPVAGEAGAPAGGEFRIVVPELQRLRFGAAETWARPEQVFRRARQALAAARRARRVTRSGA